MTRKTYLQRIAESKTRIDAECRRRAWGCATAAELIAVMRDRGVAIDPAYAALLVARRGIR